jgi:magnesium transporter
MPSYFDHLFTDPGAAPGIEHDEITSLPGDSGPVRIACIDYSPQQVSIQTVGNLEEFISRHRPEWTTVRWIIVDGLSDKRAIQALAAKYALHPLAIEDMLQNKTRPKVESYGGGDTGYAARLFIVTHALRMSDGRLEPEQVSIFLGHTTVISFQENPGSEWDPILQRIQATGSRLRNSDASFLAYSLLDAVVDGCFPILEVFSERSEDLEIQILERTDASILGKVHQFKRDLQLLRWVFWPMREVVFSLQRETHECVSDATRVYLRDLYDHVIQIIELIETYRENASDLIETYMSTVSNRMNEIMKVLTIIGTIFIPLTFLAGVYGMNFRFFPELNWPWAYPSFWVISLVTAGIMLVIFRRRNWI